MSWDGVKRRADDFKANDHDTIIELVQIMKNHIDHFNEHRDDFHEHKMEDNKSFEILKKMSYMGMGGLAVLQFIILIIRH